MMRVLVNASTLAVGGGLQIGLGFINYVITQEKEIHWMFIVSKGIYENLSDELKIDERIVLLVKPPSNPILGLSSIYTLKRIERIFKPNIIYSLGFPSYVRFSAPEIGRYTNPWEINPDPLPWYIYKSKIKRFLLKLGTIYRLYWAKRATVIETQTHFAKEVIADKLNLSGDRVFVIPNSINEVFYKNSIKAKSPIIKDNIIAFCIAAPYDHKGLEIIPEVAFHLRNNFQINVLFQVTIPLCSSLWKRISKRAKDWAVDDLVVNVGPLKVVECVDYYNRASLVFLPTLLEVFSATFLEAMAMKVPIVTTNLYFSKEVCKDAAVYFTPNDAFDAAQKVHLIVSDNDLVMSCIKKGNTVIANYPKTDEKYKQIVQMFNVVVGK